MVDKPGDVLQIIRSVRVVCRHSPLRLQGKQIIGAPSARAVWCTFYPHWCSCCRSFCCGWWPLQASLRNKLCSAALCGKRLSWEQATAWLAGRHRTRRRLSSSITGASNHHGHTLQIRHQVAIRHPV